MGSGVRVQGLFTECVRTIMTVLNHKTVAVTTATRFSALFEPLSAKHNSRLAELFGRQVLGRPVLSIASLSRA